MLGQYVFIYQKELYIYIYIEWTFLPNTIDSMTTGTAA